MRGSVRRWRSGWQWRVRTPDGREISKSGYRLQGEAEDALNKILAKMGEGRFVAPDRITVGEYVDDVWLPAVKNSVGPSQYANYCIILERHIKKHIGDVRLQKLTEPQVIRMYRELEKTGHRYSTDENPRGLSPKSVRHVHTMLHRALDDAIEWHYVARNVAESKKTKPPKPKRSADVKVWTAAELQSFLSSQPEDRLYPLWRFMAMTGVRRGEALGLEWASVDLKAASVSIVRARTLHGVSAPKTDRSRRSIELDRQTVSVLKAWRKRQLEERVKWGEHWTDTGLVFTREDGRGYHPDGITGIFERLQRQYNDARKKEAEEKKKAGARDEDCQPELLPRIRLHDLRHTHATLLLASGVNAKIVSERLGHASVAFTLTVYAHVLPGQQKEAIGRLAALVDG